MTSVYVQEQEKLNATSEYITGREGRVPSSTIRSVLTGRRACSGMLLGLLGRFRAA